MADWRRTVLLSSAQEEAENTSKQISDNDNEKTAQGWNGLIISTVSANVFISVFVFRS